jgi:23S rRNA pseudouridine1911/1915/1917 synthase
VLLIAKDLKTQEALARQFKEREVEKTYVAVVWGHLRPQAGTITLPIGRHPVDRKKMAVRVRSGRSAVTHYRVVREIPGLSLVRLRLETGRTHQLRVHLAATGHPIVGDAVYGSRTRPRQVPVEVLNFPRQALHAAIITFRHPASQTPVTIRAPYPEDFAALLALFGNGEKAVA